MSKDKGGRNNDSPFFAGGMEPETFRLLVGAAPTPMIAVGEEGRIAMANRAAERLVSREARELIGEPMETSLPEGLQPLHGEHRSEFLKNPEPRLMGQGRDLFILTRDGSTVPVEIGLSPVATPEGIVVPIWPGSVSPPS